MKYIKTLLVTLTLVFTFSIVKVNAAFLTIDADNTGYDKNTNKFNISGTASFDNVMVGIFDSNNQLISFKTVTSDNNDNYNAVFNIVFSEDQTVIVKVGDIGENNHKLLNVDVEKSSNPYIQTLTEEGSGNKLTILDSLKHFKNGDRLSIEAVLDLNSLDDDSKQLLSAYQNKITAKRKIVGLMKIAVYNGNDERNLEELQKGYKLLINDDGSAIAAFNKPYIARITDPTVIGLEDGILLEYSADEGGIPALLNNTGIYLLIDDTSVTYKFSDETKNQIYNLITDDTLTFKINADKDKFLKLYIDKQEVDSKYYDVKSGSTIITLKKDFLKNLSVGTHTVYVDFSDGYASGSFKVVSQNETNENTNKKGSNPLTLDNIMKYGSLLIISSVGLCVGIKRLKRN